MKDKEHQAIRILNLDYKLAIVQIYEEIREIVRNFGSIHIENIEQNSYRAIVIDLILFFAGT